MKHRIVVLGAGFGGLEVASLLSESMGEQIELTLIDKNDTYFFGAAKLDVMFGHKTPQEVLLKYRNIFMPGVTFKQAMVTGIDPAKRTVTTNLGKYEADVLVVALGADYDPSATPGLVEGGNEFYSFSGAERLREVLPGFSKGRVVVGVTSTIFKCPPAPGEAALLMDDYLTQRGVRQNCEISLVMPFSIPIPPSPETSQALLAAFAGRGITFVPNRRVQALEPLYKQVILDDGTQMPYDLFLGIPKHQVPQVVTESGLAVDGWIPVDPQSLKTRFPGVYAVGDVTSAGTAKAGTFAEGAGRVVAQSLIAEWTGGEQPPAYAGAGTCYIEFGAGKAAKLEINFLSGPAPTGKFYGASEALAHEKREFGARRRKRWFGS